MTGLWALFFGLALLLVVLEATLAGRQAAGEDPPSARHDLLLYAASVAAVAAFAAAVWWRAGADAALAFTAGWVLEQALSVDNLFVFLLVFRALGIPPGLQGRVLRFGIAGAVVMRGAFLVLGLALTRRMSGAFYVFGAVLVLSAVKVLWGFARGRPEETTGMIGRWRTWLPFTSELHGARFFAREKGGLRPTPLFAALLAVEAGDVVFAVDSVPAVLSVTQEPLWVASSNLFAILGLRTLFRLLARAAGRLHYLELGLGGILLFVGAKMLLHAVVEIGVGASLAVVVGLFSASVVASLARERARGRGPEAA